jgi:mannuronan 5-epimerase
MIYEKDDFTQKHQWNRTWVMDGKFLLTVAAALLMFISNSMAGGLKTFSVKTVPTEYVQAIKESLNDELECCETRFSNIITEKRKNTKSAYRLETLFSSQQGSWMFQSFVNNGLFKVASSYQPSHPKALMITEGFADLEWLHRVVNDSSIIAKEGDKYRLSYPLIIGKNATLFIDDKLELNAVSGTALINLGTLILNKAFVVGSVAGEKQGKGSFRPFITSWNGSETYIYHSELSGLGYDAHLSHGISIIKHAGLSGASAWIEVVDSHLKGMETGLTVTGAKGIISKNHIESSRQYGINAKNSSLKIEQNIIKNTALNSGMHLQSPYRTIVKKNKIERSKKAGVSVGGRVGRLKVIGNQLLSNHGSGILIEATDTSDNGYIQALGNILAHNEQSGIQTNCVYICHIEKNIFIANQQYAISFLNSPQFADHSLLITENSFAQSPNELIQVSGLQHLIFGNNKLALNPGSHSVFSGELQSIQSKILRNTLSNNEIVEIQVQHQGVKGK